MNRKVGWILGLLAALIATGIGGIAWYGSTLPEQHQVQVGAVVPQACDRAWGVIADATTYPTWWKKVSAASRETLEDGTPLLWLTTGMGQKRGFVTLEETAPSLLVWQTYPDDLDIGNTWTIELTDAADEDETTSGCDIRITEDGYIKPVFYRGFMQLRGPDSVLDSYMDALKEKLGKS